MKFVCANVCFAGICIFLVVAKRNRTNMESSPDDFEALIGDVLVNTLQPHKCLGIVTDDVYYGVFTGALFRKFATRVSMFTIFVEESEDLLSPYPHTQRSLLTAKEHDCQTYVILIANGIQVARLLRFGDRYRVLDTRAQFVLLYDSRLFETNLHYLWKRIVNVIFIRENRGDSRRSVPWFEITTVPFPAPIQKVLVPKRLDIWRRSKFRTGIDLFRDKTSDLRNQTMRVVTFKHTPAIAEIPPGDEIGVRAVMIAGRRAFTGLEIEILATVAAAMNFKCEIYEPVNANSELWGRRLSGSQFSGLYGEMMNDKADIALGDLYYVSYVLDLMDLTVPYNAECLTFLTPESLTDNSWKTLVLPFKAIMWVMVLTCLFLSGVFFYGLARFQRKFSPKTTDRGIKDRKTFIVALPLDKLKPHVKYTMMKEQIESWNKTNERTGLHLFDDFFNSMLYAYSMLVMVSLPTLPTGWSLRIMTGCYWLYCTLVVVSYRASMTAILANPASRVTIDTLQELVDSSLSCGGWGEINRELFQTSLDTASQTIGSKFEIVNDSDRAVERVSEGSFAFFENVFFLKEASVKRQTERDIFKSTTNAHESQTAARRGDRNLHIMKDCIINMPISIGLQKNSPIKPRVDKYVRKILEAGLVKKWLDDVMEPTVTVEKPRSLETTKALMDMNKFIGAIVALFIGHFVGVVVLMVEVCYFKRVVTKHPLYNKYSKTIQGSKKL